ncbi:hypothetical protein ACQ4PT_042330 [Festuca glaucescens]
MATSPHVEPPCDGGCRDRLSDLPDGVLGTILSFLPTKEAARAAALARRWRRTFAGVDTISFVQREAHDNENYTFMKEALERRSRNGDFIDEVNAALLCRRRCGGHAAPRVFCVNFGRYDCWDRPMLDRWLYYVLNRSARELHLDLRLQHALVGERYLGEPRYSDDADSDADFPASSECNAYGYEAHEYKLPRRLFSCAAIRTLCLGACSLQPPELIALPFLETLVLRNIRRLGTNIQRLVSSCPRLIDLTLERCGEEAKCFKTPAPDHSYTITVLDRHLRRFAIRCCHNLVRASIDASELREIDYRGAVPSESLLDLRGVDKKIFSCSIGFCGKKVYKGEFPRFRNLLDKFTGTRHLHLDSTHLGSDLGSKSFAGFPSLPNLARLELSGYLRIGSIEAMTRILDQAPSVEVLSLFLKPTYQERFETDWPSLHGLRVEIVVRDISVSCLRNRVRCINLVNYQGHKARRKVAKLLFCNALVLEQGCVVFPRGPHDVQLELKNEIEGWVVNKSAKIVF